MFDELRESAWRYFFPTFLALSAYVLAFYAGYMQGRLRESERWRRGYDSAMSTHWDVHCRTCNSDLGLDLNHQEQLMLALCRTAPWLASMASSLAYVREALAAQVSWHSPYIALDERLHLDVAWFKRHEGHDLVPKNEYGQCSDECGERYACTSCGSFEACKLKLGHDGAHAKKAAP